MKSLKQIKKELHEYIDDISDEKKLMVLYESTLKHLKNDIRKGNISENGPLVNLQQKELDETINNGSLIGNKKEKELNKSISRWFNDGGRNPI